MRIIIGLLVIGFVEAFYFGAPWYIFLALAIFTAVSIFLEHNYMRPKRKFERKDELKALIRDIHHVLNELKLEADVGEPGITAPKISELQFLVRDRRFEAVHGKGAPGTEREKAKYLPNTRLFRQLIDELSSTEYLSVVEQGYNKNRRYQLGRRFRLAAV